MESVKSVRERRKRILINLNAVWFYDRKRNSGCNFYCEEDTGGISNEGQEVVLVLFYME